MAAGQCSRLERLLLNNVPRKSDHGSLSQPSCKIFHVVLSHPAIYIRTGSAPSGAWEPGDLLKLHRRQMTKAGRSLPCCGARKEVAGATEHNDAVPSLCLSLCVHVPQTEGLISGPGLIDTTSAIPSSCIKVWVPGHERQLLGAGRDVATRPVVPVWWLLCVFYVHNSRVYRGKNAF